MDSISIIVPVYNGDRFIGRCLESILRNKTDVPFELIVVDDGSTDRTAEIVRSFPCSYYRIEKSGVAAARNLGIRKAKGEILFFFDADVILREDTLSRFLKHFQEDPDVCVVQGRWDSESPSRAFASRFFLLKYTYSLNQLMDKARRTEVANLETGNMAVKAEVFRQVGGFDEGYKSAGGEEHELGLRILQRYKIYYYADLFVGHEFGGFRGTLRKIFLRTVNFSMLSFHAKKKDFMSLHRASVPLQDKLSVVLVFLLAGCCLLAFANVGIAVLGAAAVVFFYLLNISKFLLFLLAREGFFFALASGLADFVVMLPRLAGVLVAAFVFHVLKNRELKL